MKKTMETGKKPTGDQYAGLIRILGTRFEKNRSRHRGMHWDEVEARLENNPGRLRSLLGMENTGGEPDVIGFDSHTGEYLFADCSPESPAGRRSLCYDREGLESRKDHKPATSAIDMAEAMGIELLNEEEYLDLQRLGKFDTRTSSWVKTPPDVRKQGGALFADFRYGRVFFYHNSAPSYYAARGFRGLLRV